MVLSTYKVTSLFNFPSDGGIDPLNKLPEIFLLMKEITFRFSFSQKLQMNIDNSSIQLYHNYMFTIRPLPRK